MKELECGRILNTHGVRGELKIDPYCDMPILRKLETVYLDGIPYKIYFSGGSYYDYKDDKKRTFHRTS